MSEDRVDPLYVADLIADLRDGPRRVFGSGGACRRWMQLQMDQAASALEELSAEVERLRPAAGAAVTASRENACLDRFDGKVATMLCIADRGHAGRHDYHRIENVSIIGGEGEDNGPR